MALQLIAKKGPLKGMAISLDEGTKWSLGKDPTKSDILIRDDSLADCQVLIYKEQVGFFIRNLDTKYNIKINDQNLIKAVLLKNDDTILLGKNVFSVVIDSSDNDSIEFELDVSSKETKKKSQEQKKPDSSEAQGTNISKVTKDKSGAPLPKVSLENVDKTTLPEVNLEGAIVSDESEDKRSISDTASSNSDQKQTNSEVAAKDQYNPGSQEDNQEMKEEKMESSESDKPKEVASAADGQSLNTEEPKDQGIVQEKSDSNTDDKPKEVASAAETNVPTEDIVQDGSSNKQDVNAPDIQSQKAAPAASKEETKDTNSLNKNSSVTFGIKDLFDFDDNIFSVEDESSDSFVDLSHVSRFLLKVVAGPNIGAEFNLEVGQEYVLGSDASICDLIFNDLSVSHKHAKLIVGKEGNIIIEDLGSRNGVIVDGKKIEHSTSVLPNQVIALGTTLFLVIDREAPVETIVSSLFLPETYVHPKDKEELSEEEQAILLANKEETKATISTGAFILALFVGGLAILFGIGAASLFHTKEVNPIENVDFDSELEVLIKQFPGVRFTYNKNNGQLFLIGHISNSISKSELLYKLDALPFIKSIDDNVIDNELVWQEMNIFLSKHSDFKGVSMHSPEPGVFVLTGYLQTEDQAANLVDYLNIHFNYVALLQNKVVVERILLKEIGGLLLQGGFAGVQVSFSAGELVLTGYVSDLKDGSRFRTTVEAIASLPGVRNIKNFVIQLPVEEGVADLNVRYPNRYRVTGFSKYGDVNINVVINGRIVTRGDVIDGMTVTSIQANCIFLEKDGIKFKMEYNK